jgi:hypothetical protein
MHFLETLNMADMVVYYWLKARNRSYLILETDIQQNAGSMTQYIAIVLIE